MHIHNAMLKYMKVLQAVWINGLLLVKQVYTTRVNTYRPQETEMQLFHYVVILVLLFCLSGNIQVIIFTLANKSSAYALQCLL